MEKILNNNLSSDKQKIIDGKNFDQFLNGIIHDWLRTLTLLVITLVPLFFILDIYIVPKDLLKQVALYRFIATIIVFIQYIIILKTSPGNLSFVHGYVVSIVVGGVIVLMTIDLGGFLSSYYAGLNLVIIGVNLLLPWRAIHSAINSIIIISLYISLNLSISEIVPAKYLINNLFFLTATSVISVSINYVKHVLTRKEFDLLCELKSARDSIWSEMELAKRIQTALLPDREKIHGFDIAAKMIPAKAVGGDYYDIIETKDGNKWITVGDVSGHGVDSGLIMMMAQTCILSKIKNNGSCYPSEILSSTNQILRENISRMGSDHYMTMMAINLVDNEIKVAGKHQDLLIYRSAKNEVETICIPGTWLGITNDVTDFLEDMTIRINNGDAILLFTDGITEATNREGEMFGQERLKKLFCKYANLSAIKMRDKILDKLEFFQHEQSDDITLLIVKK
jgi:serine phosphatase RsbU (regulator of sigma subunit)